MADDAVTPVRGSARRAPARWWRLGRCGLGLLFWGTLCSGQGLPPEDLVPTPPPPAAPTVLVTRPGQFEVVAPDSATAGAVLTAAREVWAVGEELRLLPEAFTTPIYVRAVPASGSEAGAEDFIHAAAEPGGVVAVRIVATPQLSLATLHRGLARGLLLRLAAAQRGASPQLRVPAWLEAAWAELAARRRDPDLGERWPAETAGLAPAPLADLLAAGAAPGGSRTELVQRVLLLRGLAEEGRRDGAWRSWMTEVLTGADALDALPRNFRGRWTDAAARELWWQMVYQAERTTRQVPWRSAAETRAWIAETARFVVARGETAVVAGPAELWALRADAAFRTELTKRHEALLAQMATMHPYYFNAAHSLGLALESLLAGREREFQAALTQLEADALEGAELEREPPDAVELAKPRRR